MSFRNDGPGNWFDDPRTGKARGVTKYGDERLTWDAAYFARTGFALWEVWVDGACVMCEADSPGDLECKLEVVGSSVSDARRGLRKSWEDQTKKPWPGHKKIVLKYLEVQG